MRYLALAVGICLGYGSAAWAGPPFITDDPEPVELHHWEVYIASMTTKTSTERSGTLPHIEINNGAAENLQVHLILPYSFDHPLGQPLRRGYGDTEIGVKYRFVQESAKRAMVGIFPLVELPTGSAGSGLGSGHTQWFLPVWLQKSRGSWTSFGGAGYWITPGQGNRNHWLLGWAAQKDVSAHLTLGGEVLRTTPATVGGPSESSFNLGGYYDFDDERHLLFSAGRGNADTEFMSYLAFQWTFPRSKAGADDAAAALGGHPGHPTRCGRTAGMPARTSMSAGRMPARINALSEAAAIRSLDRSRAAR